MRISFKNAKLRKLANSDRKAMAQLGKQGARKLRTRMDELDAAETLADLRYLPAARCHELKGNLKGFLAVSLHGGWRVLFQPDHDPVPCKMDGGLDWQQVTAIKVTAIKDYHDQ